MTAIRKLLRRTALLVPQIRQLHSDYRGALVDCQSAQLENVRLQHEIDALHDMESAVRLIDHTHESERDRYIKLLAGLQYTADTLTNENAECRELITALQEELSAARVVETSFSSENSQLKKLSTHLAAELKNAASARDAATQQMGDLRRSYESARNELSTMKTRLSEAIRRAEDSEKLQSAIKDLSESTNLISQNLDSYHSATNEAEGKLQNQIEALGNNLTDQKRSVSLQLETLIGSVTANGKASDIQSALQKQSETTQAAHDKIVAGIHSQLKQELSELGGHLDNLTASTATNLDKLAGSVRSHIEGLSSVQESTGLMQRTRLNQLINALGQNSSLPTGQKRAGGAVTSITDQWLDLLESVLTGTANEDVPMSPWSGEAFDPSVRIIGRDWPKTAYTMIGTARMRNLRALTEKVLTDGITGDLLEAGTWRGGACIYMKAILKAHSEEHRRVFVADSFRGLPKPDEEKYKADAGDEHHIWKQLAASRQDVQANFGKFNLLDDRVVFLEGWFKDTLPIAPVENLAILRLDGDMYESTMDTLTALYHKVTPGGFVIVDDYLLPPCQQAVTEFREANNISETIHDVDGAAVYWQVS